MAQIKGFLPEPIFSDFITAVRAGKRTSVINFFNSGVYLLLSNERDEKLLECLGDYDPTFSPIIEEFRKAEIRSRSEGEKILAAQEWAEDERKRLEKEAREEEQRRVAVAASLKLWRQTEPRYMSLCQKFDSLEKKPTKPADKKGDKKARKGEDTVKVLQKQLAEMKSENISKLKLSTERKLLFDQIIEIELKFPEHIPAANRYHNIFISFYTNHANLSQEVHSEDAKKVALKLKKYVEKQKGLVLQILRKCCKNCGITGEMTSQCMQCEWAYFCSPKCQRENLFAHRNECPRSERITHHHREIGQLTLNVMHHERELEHAERKIEEERLEQEALLAGLEEKKRAREEETRQKLEEEERFKREEADRRAKEKEERRREAEKREAEEAEERRKVRAAEEELKRKLKKARQDEEARHILKLQQQDAKKAKEEEERKMREAAEAEEQRRLEAAKKQRKEEKRIARERETVEKLAKEREREAKKAAAAASLGCAVCLIKGHTEKNCDAKYCYSCKRLSDHSECFHYGSPYTSVSCTICQKHGHAFDYCRSKFQCKICGNQGHTSKICRSKTKCENCERQGHCYFDCDRANLCLNCNSRGHAGNMCPSFAKCRECKGEGHYYLFCPINLRCDRCDQGHLVYECPFYTCLNCLGQHRLSDCPMTVTCFNCDGDHHHKYCPQKLDCKFCHADHVISICPKLRKHCVYCDDRGHSISECPSAPWCSCGIKTHVEENCFRKKNEIGRRALGPLENKNKISKAARHAGELGYDDDEYSINYPPPKKSAAENRAKSGGVLDIQCRECEEWGHKAYECPYQRCYNCQGRGHGSKSCPTKQRITKPGLCAFCGSHTHKVANCREAGRCRNCNGIGHMPAECPSPPLSLSSSLAPSRPPFLVPAASNPSLRPAESFSISEVRIFELGATSAENNSTVCLREAILRKDILTVKNCRDKNPDLEFQDENGDTVLHLCAAANAVEIYKLLRDFVIHDIPNEKNNLPVHVACMRNNSTLAAAMWERTELKNHPNHGGYTPLHYACLYADDSLVEILSKNGADLNLKNALGETALHLAAGREGRQCEYLINSGADTEIGDLLNWTPIFHAVSSSRSENVSLLACANANIYHVSKHMRSTLFHLAARVNDGPTLSALVPHLSPSDPILSAPDKTTWTPLHYAALLGSYEVVKILAESGADLHAKTKESDSPLHVAISVGQISTAQILISVGTNIQVQDQIGNSPLYTAARYGQKACVEMLVENRADINAVNYYLDTPLHGAARYGHLTVAEFLISSGCDPSMKDNDGKTAETVAEEEGRFDVLNFLKSLRA